MLMHTLIKRRNEAKHYVVDWLTVELKQSVVRCSWKTNIFSIYFFIYYFRSEDEIVTQNLIEFCRLPINGKLIEVRKKKTVRRSKMYNNLSMEIENNNLV